MDTYKHGFVVKSQEELEELMGPPNSDGGWDNQKDEWVDSFVSEMREYIGKRFFGKPEGIDGVVCAWGWYFDTRWVHELKQCTLEELIKLSIPLDKVYAVCVPDDRILRLAEDDVDLVVDVIEFLGRLWMPDELEVLYIEQN